MIPRQLRPGKISRSALWLFLFIALTMAAFMLSAGVGAQSDESLWSGPTNLSLSGGAEMPRAVADATGRLHVVWQDVSNTFYYTVNEVGSWQPPEPVELPFGTRRYSEEIEDDDPTPIYDPILAADGDGDIHALWRDEAQTLFYSQVDAGFFDNYNGWAPRQLLAEAALDAVISADAAGRLHLAYVRPLNSDDFSSGVYYRRSSNGGQSWSPSILLYASPYYRALADEEANVQVTTQGEDVVIVAWDNPALERVYIARSGDSGANWDEPIEIDRRQQEDSEVTAGPGQIRVASDDAEIHVIWQSGHADQICNLYHQVSADGGLTWSSPLQVTESLAECPEEIRLIADRGSEPGDEPAGNPDGNTFILYDLETGVFITSWRDGAWLEPEFQLGLEAFIDPETVRTVDFGCLQTALTTLGDETGRLFLTITGCDLAGGADIWFRSRPVADLVVIPEPTPIPIWRMSNVIAAAAVEEPVLLSDNDGLLHAFWRQVSAAGGSSAIFYSRWDGTGWSPPVSVLRAPDSDQAYQPAVTLDTQGQLAAVWSNGPPGDLWFSQAATVNALSSADWSSPVIIPMPRPAASSPAITVDRVGVLYVAYALPLNEERGIYMVQSADGGSTWLSPVRVFDAVAAGWDMVDRPSVSVGLDDTLHLLFTRFTPPPDGRAETLYYSRSVDNGVNWEEAEQVTATPTGWSRVVAVGEQEVHRLWQEADGIWHNYSIDAGISWSLAQRVSNLGVTIGPADVVLNAVGQPILVHTEGPTTGQAILDEPRPFALQYWTWADGRWSAGEGRELGPAPANGLASAVQAGKSLAVLLTGPVADPESGDLVESVYFSDRPLPAPEFIPTPLPTLTPTPLPTPTATPLPEVLPTPTVSFPVEAESGGGLGLPIDTSNPLIGTLLGIVPAAIIVVVAIFIGLRLMRRDN